MTGEKRWAHNRNEEEGDEGVSAEMMKAMLGMDDEQTEKMLMMTRSNFTEEVGAEERSSVRGRDRKSEGEAREGGEDLADATQDLCKEKTQGAEGMGKGCKGKGEHGKEGGRGGKGARQPSEEDEEDKRTVNGV